MSRRRIRFISTTASQRRMLDTRCLILDQTQSDRASSIQNLASRSLCPWVKLPMHSFKPLLIDVRDRKSTRLNSSHVAISYAVFCLKKKKRQDVNINIQ